MTEPVGDGSPASMMRFLVRIAIVGSPPGLFMDAISDLREELEARGHLHHPHVRWDAEMQVVIVEVEDEAPEAEMAGAGVSDDVSDAVFAMVIGAWDTMRLELLEVRRVG